jgi:hypothetical protein
MISPIARELAAKIAPAIQSQVSARKEDIIRGAGPLPLRAAVRLGFSTFVREVPTLAEAGTDALLDEFGGLSLADIATKVILHSQAKGRATHPSLVDPGPGAEWR